MRFASIVSVGLVLLALGGCLVDQNLTQQHLRAGSGPAWFHALCADGGSESSYNCQAVLQSEWAYLRFGRVNPQTGQRPGIPVAMLGWFYFSALFAWFLFVGRPNHAGRRWQLLPLLVVGSGCGVSAFYTYIMFTRLEARCPWCLVSHAINLLMLIGVILQWPRRPAAVDESPIVSPPSHPSPRLALCAMFAGAALMVTDFQVALRHRATAVAAQVQDALKRIYDDADTLMASLLDQPRVDVAIRADDPQRFTDEGQMTLIVFSDFQCPACRAFAGHIDKVLHADYPALFKVVWKHFPSSTACNPSARRDLHPSACQAAYLAEAARALGGNAAFWQAHDWLFERQGELARLDDAALAADLGLDPEELRAAAASDAVRDRVRADVDQAIALKVKGTPGVFLDGRRTQRHTLHNRTLLAQLQARLNRQRGATGTPPPAASPITAATPGSPDQPGAQ